MEKEYLLEVKSEILYFTGGRKVSVDKNLIIPKGISVLFGPNGSGKTTFAQIIEKGRNFRTNSIYHNGRDYPKIKYIEFHDIHSWTGLSVEYYQQRYESSMNDEVPTVAEILGKKSNSGEFKNLCNQFDLEDINSKKINFLSSGELRKLLIINALSEKPDLLILDNPYIGLDSESQKNLNEALIHLKASGKSVLLLVSSKKDIPEFTDDIIYADNLKITKKEPESINREVPKFEFKNAISNQYEDGFIDEDNIFELKDCNIKYDNIIILKELNWKVKKGEKWSLSGSNGSGKSTLLSLVNADNPKAYCNNLYLFGRRRGSGESIWDIKKRIGYVSPEMQLHFHGSGTVLQLVANGLNDTVGLYVKPTEQQLNEALKWLEYLNIEYLKDRAFNTISTGERQLALFARSIIKQPELLILDEPMHGLDDYNQVLVKNTINDFLTSHPKSAFIMVTHNPEELPDCIEQHFILKKF